MISLEAAARVASAARRFLETSRTAAGYNPALAHEGGSTAETLLSPALIGSDDSMVEA